MGAVVTRDVPDDSVVIGSPATIRFSREEYDKKQMKWKQS
jgi:acetyltransferase-like isoleucine patch superfamily enzyme